MDHRIIHLYRHRDKARSDTFQLKIQLEEQNINIPKELQRETHTRIRRQVDSLYAPLELPTTILNKFTLVKKLWADIANTADLKVETLLSYKEALYDAIDTAILDILEPDKDNTHN